MNKKIGIITIQKSSVSYGACLQTHALYSYLNSLGFNCEIIDLYRPVIKNYVHDISPLSFSTCKKDEKKSFLKTYIKRLLYFIEISKREKQNSFKLKKFESFNSLLNYSKPYTSIADLYKDPPIYDYYVSGSDQIWNPDMPFENEPYLLSFVPEGGKLVSYASSFGRDNLPKEYQDYFAKFLKRYNSISVREESGKFIINELIGKEPFVALDPTLLLNNNYWSNILVNNDINQKYLFCFSLHNDLDLINYSISICKERDLALVIITNKDIVLDNDLEIINKFDSGPREWLGLIQSAELVITDSFHGTTFSILFEKQFYSYVKAKNNEKCHGTRIESLLIKLSIEERLINNLVIKVENKKIEFNKVNSKLEILRTLSEEYLLGALI